MKQCNACALIAQLDGIRMSNLERHRAKQLARRAEDIVCALFAVGRLPRLIALRLARAVSRGGTPERSTPR